MQVKLFVASGAAEINAIESEINKWLGSLTTDVEVKHVSSAFAGIAPNSQVRTRPGSVLIGRHSFDSTSCPTCPTTRSQQEKVEDCYCYSAQCPRTQN